MIKKRNLLVQVILMIVTLGIYALYWYYVTAEEMARYKKTDASPALLLILLFVPIISLWSIYKYSELYETFTDGAFNKWVLFLLWLVFSPAVWFIVQTKLNELADKADKPEPVVSS